MRRLQGNFRFLGDSKALGDTICVEALEPVNGIPEIYLKTLIGMFFHSVYPEYRLIPLDGQANCQTFVAQLKKH